LDRTGKQHRKPDIIKEATIETKGKRRKEAKKGTPSVALVVGWQQQNNESLSRLLVLLPLSAFAGE
jgi:hypothetical protein